MTLSEKFSILMKRENLNKRQLSIKSSIPYSTIDNIWKRGTESMRLPTFGKLCHFFGVTMESMAYDDLDIEYLPAAGSDSIPKMTKVSDEAMHIARAYDSAPEGIKDSVAKLLDVKRADTTGLVAHYSA